VKYLVNGNELQPCGILRRLYENASVGRHESLKRAAKYLAQQAKEEQRGETVQAR
jgi:hypothetical protein